MPIIAITPDILKRMLQENSSLQLVDVRTPEEFRYLGHLPEARPIPLHELPYAFRMLDPHEDVVVICQHGLRSMDACYFLEAQGFDKLFNLQEGMSAWTEPVERDISSLESLINPTTQGD